MSTAHRIDVHQHVVPTFWAKELPTHGGDPSGTVIPADCGLMRAEARRHRCRASSELRPG
jgi:hypothetical protein